MLNDLPRITVRGIQCKSDLALFSSHGFTHLLSLYGATQQVKAACALFVGYEVLHAHHADQAVQIKRVRDVHYRIRVSSIGHGKAHGLIFIEDGQDSVIVWAPPKTEDEAFLAFLRSRRIPLLDEWLPALKPLLLNSNCLYPLEGWGAQGYCINDAAWNDDLVCDLIVKHILQARQSSPRYPATAAA